jgi:lia operon protein LiaG
MKRSGLNILGIIFGILSIAIVFTVAAILIGQQSARPIFTLHHSFRMNKLEDLFARNELTEQGEETFTGKYSELDIESISGDIEIHGWNENYVKLEYTKAAPSREYLDYLTVKIDEDDDTLSIERAFTGSGIPPRGEIDFTVSVPRGLLDELSAKTVSGKITCSNMSETTDMDLHTTSGRIETDGGRNFSAKTVSGEIVFISFGDDIDIRTTSGRIAGDLRLAGSRGSIDIHSVSGSVRLTVPDTFAADVDIRSISGSVDTDFPIQVTSSQRNSLKGTIGGGGVSVNINTTTGAVNIRKAAGDA